MDIPIYSAGRNKYYIHNREQENQPDTVVYDHVKKEIICTNREIFTEKKKIPRRELREQLIYSGYKSMLLSMPLGDIQKDCVHNS